MVKFGGWFRVFPSWISVVGNSVGWSRLERQTSWVSPLEKNFLLTEHLVPVSRLTFSIKFAERFNHEYMQNCMIFFFPFHCEYKYLKQWKSKVIICCKVGIYIFNNIWSPNCMYWKRQELLKWVMNTSLGAFKHLHKILHEWSSSYAWISIFNTWKHELWAAPFTLSVAHWGLCEEQTLCVKQKIKFLGVTLSFS